MQKALKTLIKISQSRLDERRRALVAVLEQKERILSKANITQAEMQEEQKKFANNQDIELKILLKNYLLNAKKKQEELIQQANKLNPQINRINEEVRNLFSEVKKYEIIKEQQLTKQRQLLSKKEQLEQDEIAIQKYLDSLKEHQ